MKRRSRLSLIINHLSFIIAAVASATAAANPWRPGWDGNTPPVSVGMFDTAGFNASGEFVNRARTDSRYRLTFDAPEWQNGAYSLYEVSMRVRVDAKSAVWLTLGEGAVRIGNEQGTWHILTGKDLHPMTAGWLTEPTGEYAITAQFFISADGAIANVKADRTPTYLSAPSFWKSTPVHTQDWQDAYLSLRGANSALLSVAGRWRNPETLILVR